MSSKTEQAIELRRQAEEKFQTLEPSAFTSLPKDEVEKLFHELRVHQIELEMQNEELRETQLELEAARARYFELYDLAPVGYLSVSEKGLILEANLTFSSLLNVPRSALLKKPLTQFILAEDEDIYYLHRKALFETGAPQMCELRMLKSDGEVFWAHLTATATRDAAENPTCRVTLSDISERKLAEAEKDRLMAAIEQAEETVVITDAEGTIEYANPSFEKVSGYPRAEALGRNPRILQSGIQDAAFYQEMWATLLRGETWTGRFINKKKDGSLYTEEATISPMKDAAGKTVNYVAVKRDVTEWLKLEDQNRQSQKMESLGQLVGGVAHDFNNLLQIINGFTEIAHMQVESNPEATESLAEVSKAGLRAKDLVSQLLVFSRQHVIDPMEFDLNTEVKQLQKMLGQLIGANIEFELIVAKDPGKVFADKSQIQQVVMNLCVNARDAMPDGGTLTIQTESVRVGSEAQTAHPWALPGRYILLSVKDTGCGMDQATCEKIFDPFFTTKEVGKGTGLGLSTVYGIVKQNRGAIQVSSEPGKGSAFKIYLPVSQPIPADPDSTPGQALAVDGGRETILVVEDEGALLKLATRFLSGAGYTVLTSTNGEEAVRVFEEHAAEIDCILMDVVMPRMGGKKAMDLILKKCPTVPHLFSSGYSKNAGHNDFIKEEGLHLLNKPYRSAELLEKIREVLDKVQ